MKPSTIYWSVNLTDGQVELYPDPDRSAGLCEVRVGSVHGQDVPVIIDGQEVGMVLVADILP